jgi:hypothetical protein
MMKSLTQTISLCSLFLLALAFPSRVYGLLTVYPSPGDLSTISNLKQSGDFTVKVNGQSLFVYESPNYFKGTPEGWAIKPQDTVSFTSFAFSGETVTVEVTSLRTVTSATIRPKSVGLPYTVSGNKITFTLTGPQKLSLEVNNQKRPLFIIAEAPDVPDTAATYYYPAPGVYKVGSFKEIKDGESVYIAAGAVVEGTFLCSGNNNKFRGRGILTAGYVSWDSWKADTSQCMISYSDAALVKKYRGASNCQFEGLIMLNSPGWYNYGSLSSSTVKNIKFLSWNANTDGLRLGGSCLMEDCLFYQNDDCLIGNWGTGNTWRNCIVWNGVYGRAIVSLVGSTARTFLWENIDIIGESTNNPVILLQNYGNTAPVTLDGYVIRNVRVESPRTMAPFIKILSLATTPAITMKNILLENITTETTLPSEGLIDVSKSSSGTSSVNGLEFRDVYIAGNLVTSLGTLKITSSGSVSNLTFTSTSAPTLLNRAVRGTVGAPGNELIVAVTVGGSTAKNLLFRAAGPSLASLGVTAPSADPKLEVLSGQTVLGSNDNYDAALAGTFTTAGAFAFTAGAKDAALTLTLQPGTYTLRVSAVGTSYGTVLAEIFELP